MDQEKKGGSAWMWAVAVVILALIAYGWYAYSNKNNNTAIVNDTNTQATTTDTMPTAALYKDGDYTATGDYNSPGGAEQVKVSLTLKNDIITAFNVISLAVRPETKIYQGKFIQGVNGSGLVLGKKITDVKLTKVSGSSLTPKGWNDAIAKIEAQAKA
jgi:uncharacterized protein with FMN-binding domain